MNIDDNRIKVTYWEGGDYSTGCVYEYDITQHSPSHVIGCSHQRCVGGGFRVWSLIDEVKRNQKPISGTRVECKGRERGGTYCLNFIEVTIAIETS